MDFSPSRPSSLLLPMLCCFSAVAQTRMTLHGNVTDPTGAAVPAATVRIETSSGDRLGETQTRANGDFDLVNLAPGAYQVLVTATKGFAAATLPVTLPTANNTLSIRLKPEAISETVEVGAIDPLSTQAADNKDAVAVSGADLQKLPVFDQNIVAALTPFLDPGSAAGGIMILVDGVEMKASTVSPSAIAEVRINTDPYSAEFSRPGRGRINIITKPGSPDFHGTLNFIARDATFNAKNFFAPTKPAEQRRIYEGHLAGPLGHDGHTAFILSGDRKESDIASAVYAAGPQGLLSKNVGTPTRDNQISLNVNHDFSAAHRLSVGYNFEYGTRINSGVGALVLPEAGVNTTGSEHDLIFNDRLIFSPSLFNQMQVTLEKDEDDTRSVTNAPAIEVSDAFTGGGAQADVHRT